MHPRMKQQAHTAAVRPAALRQGRGRAWITIMLPTAAAACAARGEGGSPDGCNLVHVPERTSNMCTSLVAPARPATECECRGEGWARIGGGKGGAR